MQRAGVWLALCLTLVCGSVLGGPHVVTRVWRRNSELPAAQGQPLVLVLSVSNVGTSEAQNVGVSMPNWPGNGLLVSASAAPVVHIEALAPGESAQKEFIIVAKAPGELGAHDTLAQVEYRGGEGDEHARKGTAPGVTVTIISAERYRRMTASFTQEWTRFFLLAAPTWVVPLLIWSSSRRAFREQFPTS